jgi:hypothetical protein
MERVRNRPLRARRSAARGASCRGFGLEKISRRRGNNLPVSRVAAADADALGAESRSLPVLDLESDELCQRRRRIYLADDRLDVGETVRVAVQRRDVAVTAAGVATARAVAAGVAVTTRA